MPWGSEMKLTPGRLRILRLMSHPGAYALPSGKLAGVELDGRSAQLKPDWKVLFNRLGYIEQVKPPKNVGTAFVWVITRSGRDVIEVGDGA